MIVYRSGTCLLLRIITDTVVSPFSIGELVVHKKNGFVFANKEELFEYLRYWFERFPSNDSLDSIKQEFQDNLASFQNLRWTDNWNSNALPLFM